MLPSTQVYCRLHECFIDQFFYIGKYDFHLYIICVIVTLKSLKNLSERILTCEMQSNTFYYIFAFASNFVISWCCFLEMNGETFHHLVLDRKVVVVILI